jgi:hypothetical protein
MSLEREGVSKDTPTVLCARVVLQLFILCGREVLSCATIPGLVVGNLFKGVRAADGRIILKWI